MNKFLIIIISSILIASSLNSCSSFFKSNINNNDFILLKKGMNFQEIINLYKLDQSETYDIQVKDQKFQVLKIDVITNQDKVQNTPSHSGARSGYQVYNLVNPFYLVFKDSKLYNFGYVYQFRQDDSDFLVEMGNELQQISFRFNNVQKDK